MNLGDLLGLARVVVVIRVVRSLDGSAGVKGCRLTVEQWRKSFCYTVAALGARDNSIN